MEGDQEGGIEGERKRECVREMTLVTASQLAREGGGGEGRREGAGEEVKGESERKRQTG